MATKDLTVTIKVDVDPAARVLIRTFLDVNAALTKNLSFSLTLDQFGLWTRCMDCAEFEVLLLPDGRVLAQIDGHYHDRYWCAQTYADVVRDVELPPVDRPGSERLVRLPAAEMWRLESLSERAS